MASRRPELFSDLARCLHLPAFQPNRTTHLSPQPLVIRRPAHRLETCSSICVRQPIQVIRKRWRLNVYSVRDRPFLFPSFEENVRIFLPATSGYINCLFRKLVFSFSSFFVLLFLLLLFIFSTRAATSEEFRRNLIVRTKGIPVLLPVPGFLSIIPRINFSLISRGDRGDWRHDARTGIFLCGK